MNILLYAENEQVRTGLSQFLTSDGHEVAGHSESATAMEHIVQVRPDLVLATYDGGSEAIDSIFNVAQNKRCPMILIAQESQRVHAIEMLGKGVTSYLLEPLNIIELRTQIQRLADNTVVSARRFTFDVLSGLNDGFVVLSDALKILFANPATAQFIDFELEQLGGRLISTFGSPELSDMVEATLSEPKQVKQKYLRLGPKSEVVFARSTTIHDAGGKIVGVTVLLRPVDKLNLEQWSKYSALKTKLFDYFGSAPEIENLFPRFQSALDAIEAVREPVVADPIPVPVSEMLEIAQRRARTQGNWTTPCKIDMRNAEPRALCRRSIFEAMFTQFFHAAFQAGGNQVTVTARQIGGDLHFEFLDSGEKIEDFSALDFETPNTKRNQCFAMAIAQSLLAHQGGKLERHPVEVGYIVIVPANF